MYRCPHEFDYCGQVDLSRLWGTPAILSTIVDRFFVPLAVLMGIETLTTDGGLENNKIPDRGKCINFAI